LAAGSCRPLVRIAKPIFLAGRENQNEMKWVMKRSVREDSRIAVSAFEKVSALKKPLHSSRVIRLLNNFQRISSNFEKKFRCDFTQCHSPSLHSTISCLLHFQQHFNLLSSAHHITSTSSQKQPLPPFPPAAQPSQTITSIPSTPSIPCIHLQCHPSHLSASFPLRNGIDGLLQLSPLSRSQSNRPFLPSILGSFQAFRRCSRSPVRYCFHFCGRAAAMISIQKNLIADATLRSGLILHRDLRLSGQS
jgi:hypothetical protein